MRLRAVAGGFATIALLAAACGDGTGPDAGFGLSLDVAGVAGPLFLDERTLQCEADLRLTPEGTGRAQWTGGMMYFYYGVDRAEPHDSVPLSRAELDAAWRLAELPAEAQPSWWMFWAGAPFEVEVELRYTVNGRARRAPSPRIPCGVAAASPPVLTRFEPVTRWEPLEPGDTLEVRYEVSSAAGLWETEVIYDGPCVVRREFAEQLATSASRTVTIPIPWGCKLGTAATLRLRIQDASLRQVVYVREAGVLVDHTPPEFVATLLPPDQRSPSTTVSGDFFVGEPITMEILAADNHSVRAIGWEVLPGGASGSQSVSESGPQRLQVPIQPDWIGESMQIRFFARDSTGNAAFSDYSRAGAVVVRPTRELPTRTLTVAGDASAVVIDEPRGVAYLLQSGTLRLSVISLATGDVVRTVSFQTVPMDMALSAGGDSLLIALPYQWMLGVIDLRQPELLAVPWPLQTIDRTLEQRPWHVRATANGKIFVSLNASTADAKVLLELDPATGAERIRTDAGTQGRINGAPLAVSLDRSVMVVHGDAQTFARYAAATDEFIAGPSPPPYYRAPSMDRSGRRIALSLDIFDESLSLLRRVAARPTQGGYPSAMISADGEYVYHADWPIGLVRSRTSDGAMIDRTPTPHPPDGMYTSPSGRTLVVVHTDLGPVARIAIIDLQPPPPE